MRALSLWEPWASLVASGIKTLETRPRPIAGAYRGPVAIQASKHWTRAEREAWDRFSATFGGRFPRLEDMAVLGQPLVPRTLGKVLAVVDLVDVWKFSGPHDIRGLLGSEVLTGDVQVGRWGLHLASVRKLVRPVQLKGKQGLWNLTLDESREVLEAVLA